MLGYKFLVLSCFEFMVSYLLFNVGCLVKVSLKLCFGNKVPTTVVNVFVISSTVVLNHFDEGSQIQTDNFLESRTKSVTISQFTRFVLLR